MSYMTRIWPFSHKKNHYFRKEFLYDTFLLCSYFRAHPTTLLLKILGGRMYGPSPPQFLGVPSPSPPLGLRRCLQQSNTFYSKAIHFTAGPHRYHSAGQQRNTNEVTLNHNFTEIEIQRKTRGNLATILQQDSIAAEQHRRRSSIPAVLNLFRFADHLTNVVSVRD